MEPLTWQEQEEWERRLSEEELPPLPEPPEDWDDPALDETGVSVWG